LLILPTPSGGGNAGKVGADELREIAKVRDVLTQQKHWARQQPSKELLWRFLTQPMGWRSTHVLSILAAGIEDPANLDACLA